MAKQSKNNNKSETDTKLGNALVLNKYMLSLFGAKTFDELSLHLKDPSLETYDQENTSLFYHEICHHLPTNCNLSAEKLLQYDHNIYRHTNAICHERSERIRWKYFQYLTLLFTEIYLDRYFNNKEKLLNDIIDFQTNIFNNDNNNYKELATYTANDLNKLAYWCATGSGKTLLMHINILQFRHYSRGKIDINRTLLITPNAALTLQHHEQFRLSSIEANIFSKRMSGSLLDKDAIEIIEVTKLSNTDGDKTIAVTSFEANNLVLVDEGHRGSSGEVWKNMRDQLSASGFAFEYSATFGQAISSQSNAEKRKAMLDEYGHATLFDYSYRYFYNDGYGKDYQILNMSDTWNNLAVTKYLIACLLNFYEQARLFIDKRATIAPYKIEKPLAIFVGGSVNANGKLNTQELSDVVYLLKFFQTFIENHTQSVEIIETLLNGTDGLVDKNNNPIFTRSLRYIRSLQLKAEDVYKDILKVIFNNEISGAKLHIDNFRGFDGEIGLRIGNAPYFGIINVGDSTGVVKKCSENGISTMTIDYSEKSLFATLNDTGSTLNMLIGSKKFTEGWSSWRVSTMGLLNVGRSEGSQIIQLFGRGIRLKGYKTSLKRSSALDASITTGKPPQYISSLETLNIFGIRADYMELFKIIIKEEGMPANDNDYIDINIPIMPTVNLASKPLKYIKIKEGKDFKKEITVDLHNYGIGNTQITLDYYPRIIAENSKKGNKTIGTGLQNQAKLTEKHLRYLDWNKIFFELTDFKNERGWHNLTLSISFLKELAYNNTWYSLYIPEYDMQFTNFERCVSLWQEIVTTLLKLYIERTYNNAKSKWMTQNIEIATLEASHPNFEKEYNLLLHKNLDHFIDNINRLKQEISDKKFADTINISNSNDFQALHSPQHLYQPLLYINPDAFCSENIKHTIKIAPVPLNKGERDFLSDVKDFHKNNPNFFVDKSLYLLRNKSKQGIGFFDTHGFYPDFILWLITKEKQYISFIDPKGIRQLHSFDDPKVRLAQVIRTEIEPQLNDPNIILNSFIISNTPITAVSHWAGISRNKIPNKEDIKIFNDKHIYFQSEQAQVYIANMLNSMLKG